jgi:hypothetical protein
MKIRHDFVTNSSSASFVIPKKIMSHFQIIALVNHYKVFYGTLRNKEWRHFHSYIPTPSDEWYISETKQTFRGETTMDNFDMKFFLKEMGINMKKITYTDHDYAVFSDSLDYKDRKKKFQKLKEKYDISKVEGNPCSQCLVGPACEKEFHNKSACKKYLSFLKRIVKEGKRENKKRLRDE